MLLCGDLEFGMYSVTLFKLGGHLALRKRDN